MIAGSEGCNQKRVCYNIGPPKGEDVVIEGVLQRVLGTVIHLTGGRESRLSHSACSCSQTEAVALKRGLWLEKGVREGQVCVVPGSN